MPISGMVATLEEGSLEEMRRLLARELRLLCGEAQGNRIPLVLETADPRQSEEVHDWLRALPGVLNVEVVFVSFEEDDAVNDPASARSTGLRGC